MKKKKNDKNLEVKLEKNKYNNEYYSNSFSLNEVIKKKNSTIQLLEEEIKMLNETIRNKIEIIESIFNNKEKFNELNKIIEDLKIENEKLNNRILNSVNIELYNTIKSENYMLKIRISELEKRNESIIQLEKEIQKLKDVILNKETEISDLKNELEYKLKEEKIKNDINLTDLKSSLKEKIKKEGKYLNNNIHKIIDENNNLINSQNQKLIFESNCILNKNNDLIKENNNIIFKNKKLLFSEEIYKELIEEIIKKNIILESKIPSKENIILNNEVRLKDINIYKKIQYKRKEKEKEKNFLIPLIDNERDKKNMYHYVEKIDNLTKNKYNRSTVFEMTKINKKLFSNSVVI